MSEGGRPKALADEILTDARRQAESKAAEARRQAEEIAQTARTQAAAAARNTLDEAKRKLEHERAMLLADIPHLEQMRALQVKESVIAAQFDEALRAARSREPAEILADIASLAGEAVAAMDGSDFLVEVSAEDARRFGADLPARVAAEAARRSGRTVRVQVAASDGIDGGAVVRSPDGRRAVDNSYRTRMRRMREILRGRVADMLFGEKKT